MSQKSEIKCSNCGKWSVWTGKMDEKCPDCGAYLDPGRYHYAEEHKITYEKNRKSGYLVIHKTDDPIIKILKEFTNWLRWGTFYGISIIYIVIAIAIILYGVVML
jgi:hypothetical protein